MRGIGKTTLAVKLAKQIQNHFRVTGVNEFLIDSRWDNYIAIELLQ
jgi:nucleoside-triphosphatase THEP1